MSVNGQAFHYTKIKLKKMNTIYHHIYYVFNVRVTNMREILTIISFC